VEQFFRRETGGWGEEQEKLTFWVDDKKNSHNINRRGWLGNGEGQKKEEVLKSRTIGGWRRSSWGGKTRTGLGA
jgi:hypothetical protein